MAKREKPVHEERLGAIKATVWANQTQKGVMYNTTITRVYKDDDEWKDTGSFGRDDLLVVSRVAELASVWIYREQARAREEEREAA